MKENPNIHGVNEEGGIIIPINREVIEARLQREEVEKALQVEQETYQHLSAYCVDSAGQFWGKFFTNLLNAGVDFEKANPPETISKALKNIGHPNQTVCPNTKFTLEQCIRNKQVAQLSGSYQKIGHGNCMLFTSDGYLIPGKIDHQKKTLCFLKYERES